MGSDRSLSPCSGPASSDPRNQSQDSLCSTCITRGKGQRVAISQELHSSQNSPPVMPREKEVAGSIYAKKGQKGGGRGSPRNLLTLPGTSWFLSRRVMTRNPDSLIRQVFNPIPFPGGRTMPSGDGRSCHWQEDPMGSALARLQGSWVVGEN